MDPISRRDALRLALLGAAGVTAGGIGLSRAASPEGVRLPWAGSPITADPSVFREPRTLRSQDGLLRVELRAAERDVEVAGAPARVLTYNGQLPGPTWRLQPGDRLQVRLVNELTAPTNLHLHGLHVSPVGNGDNPFVSVQPGQQFDYEIQLPADHPPGTYWYHPHLHGRVADQLSGGLYGAIVIADDVPVTRERVMVVSDISVRQDGTLRPVSRPERMAGREGDLVLVNGQQRPTLTARPGETERWRVVNACTSRYLNLALAGQALQVLAIDSGRRRTPTDAEQVLLAPGNRADLLIQTRAGRSELRSVGYDRGTPMMAMMSRAAGNLSGPVPLATLEVNGAQATAVSGAGRGVEPPDLRRRRPARNRELSFTMRMGMGMGMGGVAFGFDGRPFDHERTDQAVQAGAVEDWTIHNTTPMDHPFHLHVWPMQIIDDNGLEPAEPTWRDVVNVPADGQVTVRIDFTEPVGRTVYHCHILDHEDAGMMGVVDVR